MKRVDYLIIGQGLAGSCLAMELIGRNKSVGVIDSVDPNSGSRVAAGMFNPVTSKVRQPTWMASVLFPYMDRFYRRIADELKSDFYHPLPMYRPFPVAADRDGWEEANNPFVTAIRPPNHHSAFVRDPFGGIELNMSGYCDTAMFTSVVRNRLLEHGLMLEQHVDPGWLVEDSLLKQTGISTDAVICCEGVGVRHNPLFNWLPIRPLKGEVIELEVKLPADVLFNRGAWLVPQLSGAHQHVFRAGSTYDHHIMPGNTEAGMSSIRTRLDGLLAVPFQQTGATWGLRPTVPDRRPVIGPHPERKNVWCFNGLGTKGVTLAPWFAARLADALESGGVIPEETNISRFYPLYFKSFQTT